uniref:Beta/gamma crystallin 'Greek key' domain-containing protein n=1 Tax=Hucho hucho TaxID=62062 RepID=A0A4W5MXF7_9TELE
MRIYERENFGGQMMELMDDCDSIMDRFRIRCNSCRVESGCFMVYERPNFMGHQMLVRRGEYPDNQRLMGMSQSDCIRSSRMIPMHRGSYRMKIYEKENFGGQNMELMDDCDSIQDRYRMSECQSAQVMDGHWLMFEQPHFREISHSSAKTLSGSSLGAIFKCLKVPRSSVQTIVRKYKHHRTTQPSYRPGRKRVLSPRDECTLL